MSVLCALTRGKQAVSKLSNFAQIVARSLATLPFATDVRDGVGASTLVQLRRSRPAGEDPEWCRKLDVWQSRAN
jgi:hypothetical protein